LICGVLGIKESLVCPAFSCWFLIVGSGDVGQALDGRPIMLCHSASHAGSQGQWLGRCRSGLRCGQGQAGGDVDQVAAQGGAAGCAVAGAGEAYIDAAANGRTDPRADLAAGKVIRTTQQWMRAPVPEVAGSCHTAAVDTDGSITGCGPHDYPAIAPAAEP